MEVPQIAKQVYKLESPRAQASALRRARRRRNTVIAAISATIVVIVTVALVVVFSGDRSSYSEVPSVVGLTYSQADARLRKAGLEIEIDPRLDIEEKKAGGRKVEDQQPSSGARADKSSVVTVVLEGVPVKVTEVEPPPQTAPAGEAAAPAAETPPAPEPVAAAPPSPVEVAPMDGAPLYPFTRAAINCGHWPAGSQDYPFFGASRDNGSRKHAGVDVYPPGGPGTPVKSIRAGTVVKVAPFYTRASGEVTHGVLIDHGEWVANYAEVRPQVGVGAAVAAGQQIGTVSGTAQLHFEVYAPGTRTWTSWYGSKPANLIDGTDLMLRLY